MSHRGWWLLITTLVLLGLAIAVHEATRPAQDTDASRAASASHDAGAGSGEDAGADAAMARERNAAITEAVDTLHAYLAVLFAEDRTASDIYWLDGRPGVAQEAGLRAITPVTGIRVDNERPKPLDTAPIPTALEIPVRLRIGSDGPLRRYSGHYRLRHVDGAWRITSASIQPSPLPR